MGQHNNTPAIQLKIFLLKNMFPSLNLLVKGLLFSLFYQCCYGAQGTTACNLMLHAYVAQIWGV